MPIHPSILPTSKKRFSKKAVCQCLEDLFDICVKQRRATKVEMIKIDTFSKVVAINSVARKLGLKKIEIITSDWMASVIREED